MGKIALQIRARMENLTDLRPEGGDFRWYVKLKCHACGDDTPDFVYMNLLNSDPLKGGRGSASLVLRCKLCRRENSIDILKDCFGKGKGNERGSRKNQPATGMRDYGKYELQNSEEQHFANMVIFDCRGVEPVDFSPRCGWSADGAVSGTPFTDIDLTEKEWADYDEKAGDSVGIYDLEHRFVEVKDMR